MIDVKEVVNVWKETMTKKYRCFDGRVDRKTYWTFVLSYVVLAIVLGIIPVLGWIVLIVLNLALIVPMLAITTRRLHDIGVSGWVQLLELLQPIGWLPIVYLCAQKSNEAANEYGEPVSPAAPAAS